MPPDVKAAAERARLAAVLIFLMHGLLAGGWVPHIPLVQERLGLGTGALGWLLLALAAGGVAAMPLAGALINRFGSAALCRTSGLLMCLGLTLPVYALGALALALALLLFGAALGTLDVAMNAHGVAVEKRLRHAVMSSFHGWYSVGAAIGAGGGGIVVGILGGTAHVAATSAASLAILAVSSRLLLPSEVDKRLSGAPFAWPTPATLGLGALAFLALMVEGAMFDWSAIYLRRTIGASIALAGFGFAAFSTGMALARFAGDTLRTRFGSGPLVLASALALATGLAAALAVPEPGVAIIAFGVAGRGVGNIAPVLFAGGGASRAGGARSRHRGRHHHGLLGLPVGAAPDRRRLRRDRIAPRALPHGRRRADHLPLGPRSPRGRRAEIVANDPALALVGRLSLHPSSVLS